MVADLSEIRRGKPEKCRTVNGVVQPRMERFVVPVIEGFGCCVAALAEHLAGVPVGPLAFEVVPAFQKQDPLAGPGEPAAQGAPAGPAADDDDVVPVPASVAGSFTARRSPA